jgi:AraC-like DNA-binding protein
MKIAELFFSVFAGLLGLMASILLVVFSADQKHSRRLLAFVLFAMAVPNLIGIIFFYSGLLLNYPWLYRMPAPFTILVAPAAYFYVRSVLKEEGKFRKNDWLVLVLFLLHFINMLPYFLLPFPEKQALIKSYMLEKNKLSAWDHALLPPYITPLARLLVMVPFLILQVKLIRQMRLTTPLKLQHINAGLLKWLQLFTNLMILQFVASFLVVCFSPFLSFGISPLNISIAVSLLLICLQLYFNPQLLYGLHIPTGPLAKPALADKSNVRDERSPVARELDQPGQYESALQTEQSADSSLDLSSKYKQKIEKLLENEQPYLDKDYSLEHFVLQTGIPRHTLSGFINREYGMNFREFINSYRVNYFVANSKQPHWQYLTLEAIAGECGFHNRTTFIRHFKVIMGITPSEFLNKKD